MWGALSGTLLSHFLSLSLSFLIPLYAHMHARAERELSHSISLVSLLFPPKLVALGKVDLGSRVVVSVRALGVRGGSASVAATVWVSGPELEF